MAKPWSAFLFWAAAVFFSVIISQDLNASSSGPTDPLSRFLGSATEAFGDTLFVKADVYFHGGVSHEEHHDESAEALAKEGLLGEAAEAPPKDWIARVNRRIGVHEIVHLTKEKRKEMLPFFAVATALDPRNVEAVLTTAYWLENEFQKESEALAVLKKGLKDNPGSWEIENALGRYYYRREGWREAEAYLKQAAVDSVPLKAEKYALVDLYYHLAEARLKLSMNEGALEAYRAALPFFDDKTTPFLRSSIEGKIKELSAAQ